MIKRILNNNKYQHIDKNQFSRKSLNRSIKYLLSKHVVLYSKIIIYYKNRFCIFHSQWRSPDSVSTTSAGWFSFANPHNQGNDIIILSKFKIQLILHNNSWNEYLSTIDYSRMHKINKIPLRAKISKMPPTSLFYQINCPQFRSHK